MGWLIGPTIASFVAAFLVVKLFDFIFGGVTGSIASVARACLFVVTWTAVSAKGGMRSFTRKVRQLRAGNQEMLKALTKGEQPKQKEGTR